MTGVDWFGSKGRYCFLEDRVMEEGRRNKKDLHVEVSNKPCVIHVTAIFYVKTT